MIKYRAIEEVLKPNNPHMVGDGFKVLNYFPNGESFHKRMNPFFLMDFNAEVQFPPTDKPRGVGVHPHRGFETVSIAYKGAVAHHDSYGNSGIIYPGDVQWMTAGKGILHKEYHEEEYSKKGGPFEMIQLWVNLPKKYKMSEPKYQAITHNQKGKFVLENQMGTVYVISGEFNGVKGAATTYSPVNLFDIRLNSGGEVDINVPLDYNTGVLVIEGNAIINSSHQVKATNYIQFKNEDGLIQIKATENSILLLLSGEPINEPVVNYGPFVMNTVQEIQQAIDDFNNGKFGYLEN